ncbi:MAG: NADH-quinone oxidoreductase subunit J [Gemmatimonadales bacterium]
MAEAAFYFFATTAVLGALLCILQRSPISSALWLVTTMFSLAAIYVILNAQFIAAIQVLVYAGAIMVLFLFVIMLLNLGREKSDLRGFAFWMLALIVIGVLAAQLLPLLHYTPERLALEFTRSEALANPALVFPAGAAAAAATAGQGVVGAVAQPLFEQYLVPFEITSILLLAAIVGAVVLAKRRI